MVLENPQNFVEGDRLSISFFMVVGFIKGNKVFTIGCEDDDRQGIGGF